MKSIAALGLALVACASVPAIAVAQEAASQAAPVHHTVNHRFRNGERHPMHRLEAEHGAAPAAPTPAPQAGPFGLSWPHIAPYPDGKGDEDGLSEDVNDCNKGCIGGAPN